MSQRRELTAAAVLCGLGAAIALIASGRPWARQAACADVSCLFSESRGTPAKLSSALALAALAGVVGIVAARGRGRRLVGVAIVVLGLSVMVAALGAGSQPRATAWPIVAGAAGAIVLAAGVLVAVRGHRWQQLARRYDGPQASPPATGPDADAALWDAQSRGEDPT